MIVETPEDATLYVARADVELIDHQHLEATEDLSVHLLTLEEEMCIRDSFLFGSKLGGRHIFPVITVPSEAVKFHGSVLPKDVYKRQHPSLMRISGYSLSRLREPDISVLRPVTTRVSRCLIPNIRIIMW